MIQIVIATLMWMLVASILILRHGRRERSITYAAIAIAFAMTLNIDVMYRVADRLLGTVNRATLLADGALMIGLFFLGRGIMKAGEYRPGLVRAALAKPTLLISLLCVVGMFLLIEPGPTTTEFMLEFGRQPAAAIYSMINFAYCGIVVTAMGILAWRQFRCSRGPMRLPTLQVVIGAACGLMLCVVVLVMDIAHLVGALELMAVVSTAYGPLNLMTFVFLCSGLAGQPIARATQDRARRVRSADLLDRIEPTWHRAALLHPGLSQAEDLNLGSKDAAMRLHRAIVEIRDAMLDSRIDFRVDDEELALLRASERHLLGPTGTLTTTEVASGAADDARAAGDS